MRLLLRWFWVVPLFLLCASAFYAPGIYDATDYRDGFKYLGIAWGMLQSGDYLIPTVNGVPYTDKPPLFFWLIIGWWRLFGFDLAWLQSLVCLFLFAWVVLGQATYVMLFPKDSQGKALFPYIFLGSIGIIEHMHLFRVDLILVLGVLCCNLGILTKLNLQSNLHFKRSIISDIAIMGGVVLGLFSKGPTVFIFTVLPYAICASFTQSYRKQCFRIGSMVLLGVLIFFISWTLPVMGHADHEFSQQVLFKQIVNRAGIHEFGYTYYLRYLFLLLMPWLINIVFFKQFTLSLTSFWTPERRLLLLILLCSLSILTLFGEKMVRYLLPSLPYYLIILVRYFSVNANDPRVFIFNKRFFLGLFALLGLFCVVLCLSSELRHSVFFKGYPRDYEASHIFIGSVLVLISMVWMCLQRMQRLMYFLKAVGISMLVVSIVVTTYIHAITQEVTHIGQAMQFLTEQHYAGKKVALYTEKTLGLFNFGARTGMMPVLKSDSQLQQWLKDYPDGTVITQAHVCPESMHAVMACYRRQLWKEIPFQFCQLAQESS